MIYLNDDELHSSEIVLMYALFFECCSIESFGVKKKLFLCDTVPRLY